LAKSTVSHSHTAMAHVKPPGTLWPPEVPAPPTKGSAIAMSVVSAAPTSTMNMTGLFHMRRGSSLRKAPGRAWTSCAGEMAPTRGAGAAPSDAFFGVRFGAPS
jgi:hypothetical protein